MKDRITGQDLLECAVNCMKKSGSWNKMASITTELEKIGIVKLLKNKLQTQDDRHDILSFHCIFHQESFYKVALDLKHVIDPNINVNTIRARAFHYRQFKSFLETEYEDIIYHNSERWLK